MGEDLDPFGRKKDENPLASFGWEGDETAATAAEPSRNRNREREREAMPTAVFGAAAEPSDAEPRTPPSLPGPDPDPARWRSPQGHDHAGPTATAPRRPAARLVKAVIVLGALIAVLGGVIGTLVDEGVERADRFVDEFAPPEVQAPGVPGAEDDAAAPEAGRAERVPRGLSAGSLLRPAAFGRALTRLRTGGHGRVTNLRVAPDRIDVTTVTKDGRLRLLQIVPGGALNVLQTTGGFAGAQTMTLKGVVASGPSRLTRSAAERLRQPASRVSYLVLSDFAGTRQWNIYFKGGQIFSADARGRITRRVS